MSNLPAHKINIHEIVDEYNEKVGNINNEISLFDEAVEMIERNSVVGDRYAENIFGGPTPHVYEHTIKTNLLKSAWLNIYDLLAIEMIATAKDKKKFKYTMAKPPEFTYDNIKASFGDYFINRRYHVLRGLAECFSDLDPFFKSHSNVKIGVDGLPKRIIISGVDDYSYGMYGNQKIKDVFNSYDTYMNSEHISYGDFEKLIKDAKHKPQEYKGISIKRFRNGNAHLIFSKDVLFLINKALAEFYGEVLPDASNKKHNESTTVSKNLQFYPTPEKVIDIILGELWIRDNDEILEPSCGDGRIIDKLSKLKENISVTGIEVDFKRAEICKRKGYNVLNDNFLEVIPDDKYDKVIMNPPFYGEHYLKHIIHALKFLKKDGVLISILPATAWYNHKKLPKGGAWRNLPIASFHESGTNINTGYVIYKGY